MNRKSFAFATCAFAFVAIALAVVPMTNRAKQSPDSAISSVSSRNKDDLPSLPLRSPRDLVSLTPAIQRQASSSGGPPALPCDCEQLQKSRVEARRTHQLRETLLSLQKDKKHGVHLYMVNQSQRRGRIVSVGEDSFLLKASKDKAAVSIPYKDVSWVRKEPTGTEKFGRDFGLGVALVLLAPFWIPLALLWAAAGGD